MDNMLDVLYILDRMNETNDSSFMKNYIRGKGPYSDLELFAADLDNRYRPDEEDDRLCNF